MITATFKRKICRNLAFLLRLRQISLNVTPEAKVKNEIGLSLQPDNEYRLHNLLELNRRW